MPVLNCGDCGRFTPGGAYTLDQCRLCWLHHHDPEYRAANLARAAAGESPPLPRAPCEYLTDDVADRRGRDCRACWTYGCDVYGECQPGDQEPKPGVRRCRGCPAYTPRGAAPEALRIEQHMAPGDAVVLSAAVESLHRAHPGRYLTAADTTAPRLWDHHPRVVPLDRLGRITAAARAVRGDYPAVNRSDDRAVHFMQACCESLQDQLGVPVPLLVNRPHLHLSDEERGWLPQVHELTGDPSPYWVVNAGHKADFTAKWWGDWNYQAVVDALRGRVRFAQVGELSAGHTHPPLRGVVDLRGRTDTRQLMRLVYHAAGGLGPSTLLQHLCAAFERPYVLVAGGREPVVWQSYPKQTLFSALGRLDCCRDRACWRSRTAPLGDGAEQDGSVCARPVTAGGRPPVPECLTRTDPAAVAAAVLAYME